MSGEVTADLTSISTSNLLIIIGGIILIMFVALFLVKKLGLSVSKGSISATDYNYDQRCIFINHKIKEDVDNIDWNLQKSLREQTQTFDYDITEIGKIKDMCVAARYFLISSSKEPFYACISNNHFTRQFMPSNFDSYRTNLLAALRNEHTHNMFIFNFDECKNNDMSQWENVKDEYEKLADKWLVMAMNEVKKACHQKLTLYKLEIKNMEKSKNWSEIIQQCIDKNENYIKEIDMRLSQMGDR